MDILGEKNLWSVPSLTFLSPFSSLHFGSDEYRNRNEGKSLENYMIKHRNEYLLLDGQLSARDFLSVHSMGGCDVYVKRRRTAHLPLENPSGPLQSVCANLIVLACKVHGVQSAESIDDIVK